MRSIDIFCQRCKTHLYKYAKGGKGALIKVQLHRIQQDFTSVPGQCPGCGLEFGRPFLVKGKPALKVIGGSARVFVKK